MEETTNTDKIKKKTVISTLSLFFQSGYSAFLGLVANLVLTILVSPKIFGIYIALLSLVSILNYFSDVGLAASLVQKKKISAADVKTSFTVQQLLVLAAIGTAFLFSSFIKRFYNLPIEGIYLYWAWLFAFFLSSLKTIPSIFLERQIKFQKIVLVQIVENTVFYLTVIFLAIMNFGLMSFTYGVILRAIAGLITIYSISFWKPQIGISWKSLKRLLSFGVPFQANSFLALFKDDLIILYLGKVLGFEGLGYIGWAKKWAEAPIRIIMDNISRVLFPVLSTLQDDKEKVGRIIEKIFYYQTMLLAPATIGLALIMRTFVEIIPKYGKWMPALPLFYLFCFSAFLASYSTPFINMFNAFGRIKLTFTFMFFWTVATWFLTPTLTSLFGYYGFPVTQVILSFSFVIVLINAKKLLEFRFLRSVYKSLVAASVMGAVVFIVVEITARSYFNISFAVFIGILSYYLIYKNLYNIDLISEIRSLFKYD